MFFVDKDLEVAGIGEIHLRREQGGAGDAAVLLLCMQGKRCGKQRAADTIADGIDLFLAGRLLDRIQREVDAFADIGLPILVRMALVGIDPGNDEDGVSLLDAPLDEAFLRVEVENVELVDPWRADQKRPLQHGIGCRRILDDFANITLRDHFAGGDGHIFADSEFAGVCLANAQFAFAGSDILGQHLHALDQIGATAGDRFPVELRVRGDEICR